MLKIGEFSKLSRVSVRMFRHYDRDRPIEAGGKQTPSRITAITGRISSRQLGALPLLKEMGFSLADIIRILEVYDDREKLVPFFLAVRGNWRLYRRTRHYKLTLLDAAGKRLRKEKKLSRIMSPYE